MIFVVHEIGPGQVVGQLAARKRLGLQTRIDTCLIESQRVIRSEHAQVWQNRNIVFTVAVTVW